MAYEWERDEWWNAQHHHTAIDTVCRPGRHRMALTAGGGGACTLCPETVDECEL